MKRIVLHTVLAVLVGVCLPGTAAAATTPNKNASPPWQNTKSRQTVIRGTFKQLKYLAELNQPLVSTGHYVVAAGQGLLWQVKQPIQAKLVITRQHLIKRSNGHAIMRLSAEEHPALQIVAAVLLAVFQADMAQLKQYFDIQKQSRNNGHWRMVLKPTAASVSQFIKQVSVRGAATIKRIEIQQPGGDRSVIKLDATYTGPANGTAKTQLEFLH